MPHKSKHASSHISTPPQANLEFLVVWLMSTSNRIFFLKGENDGFVQHWNLHDPSDYNNPNSVYPQDGLFNVLDWVRDIEPFINNLVWDDVKGTFFVDINNQFFDAAMNVIPNLLGTRAYSEKICPPMSEIVALLKAIQAMVSVAGNARTKKRRGLILTV